MTTIEIKTNRRINFYFGWTIANPEKRRKKKKISRRQTIIHNVTCATTLDVPSINPSNLAGYFWL